jgi:histidine triad (HIT) family protein
MSTCLFCKMAAGEIKPEVVLETADLIAFRDIHPQAPVHVLVVPKRHIATLNDLGTTDADLLGQMTLAAQGIAREAGIADSGYRLVMNCNTDGGQTVFHLHMRCMVFRSFR